LFWNKQNISVLHKTVTTEDGGIVVVRRRVVISLGRRPLHQYSQH